MANLAVNVAGVSFKNPIIPASGVFGYGREYEKLFPLSELGGIATKGTTGQPRPGIRPLAVIFFIHSVHSERTAFYMLL